MSDPTRIDIETDPTTRRMRGTAFHGNTPFDVPYVSLVADNLWQGGCETGLIVPRHIEHLVSLYPWERYVAKHKLQSELYVQMYDSEEQGYDQLDAIATWVNLCRQQGPTLVHCQAGLNRSALVVARAIHLREGYPGAEILTDLRESRSPAVLCNPAFAEEVASWT